MRTLDAWTWPDGWRLVRALDEASFLDLYEAAIRAGGFAGNQGHRNASWVWETDRTGEWPWLFLLGEEGSPRAIVMVRKSRSEDPPFLFAIFAFSEAAPSFGSSELEIQEYARRVREGIDRTPMLHLASVCCVLGGLFRRPHPSEILPVAENENVFWSEVVPSGDEIPGEPTSSGSVQILLGDLPREFVAPGSELLEEES